MISQINNVNDVVEFAKQLVEEGVSFHPDEDFCNYIDLETNMPTYSKDEATFRNELMDKCFEICATSGVDIYNIMSEVMLKETGLDKLIPLPSSTYKE
jgi:hypothetical protein